jgi:glycosyltransferase involved in cell wall biosynthesis
MDDARFPLPARPPVASAHLTLGEAIKQSRSEVPFSERPVRVLLVTDKLGYPGARLHGAGRLVTAWTQAFDPSRVRVVACALRDPSGLRAEFERDGIPITFLDAGRFDPRTIVRLIRLIRAYQIDVLHLQEFGASTLGRIAGLFTRTPSILHAHAEYTTSAVGGYPIPLRLIDRALGPLAARVVAVSHSVAEFCVTHMGFRRQQVVVIHNPLPRPVRGADEAVEAGLRRRYGLPADAPVIGAVSRFYPVKGIAFLVDAFARVLRVIPESRLLLVGDGPERDALESQARSLGIMEQVIFTGFQEDVEGHLRVCRVVALPSLHEGLPLAAIEALNAGVPIVASRVGGLPEVVSDGRTGFLVDPGNADAIADAVIRILRDPILERNLKAQCLREAGRFSMQRFVARMEEIYRETVEAWA